MADDHGLPLQAATLLGFIFSIVAFLGLPLVVVARYAHIYVKGVWYDQR